MQLEIAAPRVGRSHRLLLLASAVLVVASAPAAAADPAPSLVYVFGQADFPASNGGSLAASGDFNGDGRPDLVALNYQADSVAIQLGQPDGSFADGGVSYPVGVQPMAAAVADLNGDHNPDLVVVNQACTTEPCPPGSVSIFLGNGDGTFGARVDHECAADPVSVVVGDFNGDGKPDLAVAAGVSRISSGAPGLVSILLGDGDGGFGSHSDFPAGSGVVGLVAGDFNGQGIVDLVVDNHPSLSSHTVSLLRGAGDGSFGEPNPLVVTADPLSLATGDFNGDRRLDLAVATSAGISVLLNDGNGGFQSPVDYATGFGPFRVITADLNADGVLDLVVSVVSEILSNGSISVLLGNGDGTFQRHVDYRIGTVGQLAVGDFNGDGNLDVAVANTGTTVSILLGSGMRHPGACSRVHHRRAAVPDRQRRFQRRSKAGPGGGQQCRRPPERVGLDPGGKRRRHLRAACRFRHRQESGRSRHRRLQPR